MTGFATKTSVISFADGTKINVSISLKSLNSRFFEATCKLPHIATHLETDLIKILKNKLHRGHIYLTLHIKDSISLKGKINPNLSVADGYIEAARKIQKKFSLAGEIQINDIMRLENIFETEEKEGNKVFDKQIFKIINNLIEQLIKTRQKEGVALKKDFQKRISAMKKYISEIAKNAEKLMSEKKQEVTAIIQKIDTQEEEAADIRKSHLLLMLDKLDINEEIVRFKSHLESLEDQMEHPKSEMGKRLDFTLQEMAREINTISAKCSNAKISAIAIDIKVELEKAREQAQNIV